VLEIVLLQRLVYSWSASGEQARDGRPQDEAGYRGMGGGWPRILARLEEVASGS
jgi:uncharacterized protein YndB with AHSA1/START domain